MTRPSRLPVYFTLGEAARWLMAARPRADHRAPELAARMRIVRAVQGGRLHPDAATADGRWLFTKPTLRRLAVR